VELRAGDSLGPYEILAPLGRGGMGEVYRARDPRLRREVAIKLLREGTVGEHGLERFRRETRAVASLDHPNILAIHDMGMHGGVPYAVTELLDGETLAQRLQSGPLPPRTAAEFAAQIADGLAAAHTRGVVHRDIKPENIFLTQDGRAKILDFGLARIEKPTDDSLLSDTTEVDATRGHAVGTAGYIAPEQLRGKPADSRTDIFALGAVCYEMLTGRKAFLGPSAADRLAAVLHADPAGYAETGNIPEGLRRPILRCLEKEPADRYQSARDLLHDLRAWPIESGRAVSPHLPSKYVRSKRLLAAAAVGALFLAVGIWVGRLGRTGNVASVLDPPASRLLLSLSPPLAASVSERSAFALSPNGKHLVYCSEPEGRRRLFLRPLDTLESVPLPGTEEADGPFFSPDGQWIGFIRA
jgi:eukaryotic-like serine/threonine-protein kinase